MDILNLGNLKGGVEHGLFLASCAVYGTSESGGGNVAAEELEKRGISCGVANARFANRLLAFDEATGVMRAEAGLSLEELNRLVMPRGFFTPEAKESGFCTDIAVHADQEDDDAHVREISEWEV